MKFLAAIALTGAVSTAMALQAPPDFSGKWTAEAPPAPTFASPAPGTTPLPLPRGDMGSGWGSSIIITQDAQWLVVEQGLFSRYDIQPALRFTYSLDGVETKNRVMTGHATQTRSSRASWDGQTLRVVTSYPTVDPAGKTFTTEVTHRLSLDSPTSLVVAATRSGVLGAQSTTTHTVYRKTP